MRRREEASYRRSGYRGRRTRQLLSRVPPSIRFPANSLMTLCGRRGGNRTSNCMRRPPIRLVHMCERARPRRPGSWGRRATQLLLRVSHCISILANYLATMLRERQLAGIRIDGGTRKFDAPSVTGKQETAAAVPDDIERGSCSLEFCSSSYSWQAS